MREGLEKDEMELMDKYLGSAKLKQMLREDKLYEQLWLL